MACFIGDGLACGSGAWTRLGCGLGGRLRLKKSCWRRMGRFVGVGSPMQARDDGRLQMRFLLKAGTESRTAESSVLSLAMSPIPVLSV